MKSKLITFIGIVVVLLFFGFFVLPKGVQWRVDKYFKEKFDAELKYQDIQWTKNGIIFSGVSIYSRNEEPVQYIISAEQLTLEYLFRPFDRRIELNISIDKPHLVLAKEDHSILPQEFFKEKFKKIASDSSYIFSVNKKGRTHLLRSIIHAKINDGIVELSTLNNAYVAKKSFNLAASFGSAPEADETLLLEIDKNIIVNLKEDSSKLSFQNADLVSLFNFAQYFSPLISIDLKEGNVTGEFQLNEDALSGSAQLNALVFERTLSGIGGKFQEITVQASKKDVEAIEASLLKRMFHSTDLQLSLTKSGMVYRLKDRDNPWYLNNISGSLTVKESVEVLFKGQFVYGNQAAVPCVIQGSMPLSLQDATLTLSLEPFKATFSLVGKNIDVVFANIGKREFDLARQIVPEWAFVWNEANFLKGSVSGHLKGVLLPDNTLSEFNIEQIDGRELWFTSQSLHIDGYIERLKGNMEFVLKPNQGHLIPKNGVLNLTEGDLYWERRQENEESSLERLTHLNCSIKIEDGILQEGKFTGNLAGMQAELQFLGIRSDTLARMQLKGSASKFLKHLPFSFARELEKVSSNEEVTWNGTINKKEGTLHVVSELHVAELGKDALVIDLSATLERIPKKDWEKIPVKWQRWGVSLMDKEDRISFPFQKKGSTHILKLSWLKDELGAWGIILKQGTIKSDYFPLKPYLMPFVFADDEGGLSGSLKFTGDFNDRSLLAHFQIKDLVIENKALKVRIDEVGYAPLAESTLSDPASFIYFDFQDETSYGFIPVKKGSYEDKSNHLLFENVEALISLSKNRVQLSSVKCIADEVAFQGSIDVDLASKESIKLHIFADEVEGSVQNVQKFCSHFSTIDLWKWPLKGKLFAGEQGVIVDGMIPLDEKESLFTWKINGRLEEGSYLFSKYASDINLLSCDFTYHSEPNFLKLESIAGHLTVDGVDDYTLTLPVLKFHLGKAPIFDFDLKLETEGFEFARLNGALIPYGESDLEESVISLSPNLTHIGGIYPHVDNLILKNLSEVVNLKMAPTIDLETFGDDLKRIVRTKILPLSISTIDTIINSSLTGIVSGPIVMNEKGFVCNLEGHDVYLKDKLLENCALKVEGNGNLWKINTLQFGTFSLNSLLEKSQDNIDILELNAFDSGVQVIAKGKYSTAKKALSLDIETFTLSLADLKLSQRSKVLAKLWRPQGIVSFKGLFQVDFKEDEPKVNLSGKASIEGIELRGNRIQNQSSIPITYTSDEGLKIEGLILNIRNKDQFQHKASFTLRKAHYDFEEESLHLNSLGFSLSSNYLKELALLCQEFFPELIDDRTLSFLNDVKREGGLQGFLNIEMNADKVFIGIKLKDGKYSLLGKEFDLKNVAINYGPSNISIQAEHRINDLTLRVTLKANRPDTSTGTIIISSNPNEQNPLTAIWELDDEGFHIRKVDGGVAGIGMHWQETSPNILSGKIWLLDPASLRPILSKEHKDLLDKLKIGKGYSIAGDLTLPKENVQKMAFKGVLEGKAFSIFGIELDNLKAEINATSSKLHVTNFGITDPSLNMGIPGIFLNKNVEGQWHLSVPIARLKEFKPANLFTMGKQLKNLVIHTAELKDFSGVLENTATFKATGSFTFEKVVKNSIGNMILSIPADILGHIGLNLNAMIPASGTINFSIKDRRIYITKMIDVYSAGEKSRFLLPKSPLQSYMDFDGNLNFYIRLKQYNLLLKLTEALRVHIQGKWDNPTVNFEKNSTPAPAT